MLAFCRIVSPQLQIMKKLLVQNTFFLFLATLFFLNTAAQNSKANRPSPPDSATGKFGNSTVTVNYSSPSVKGRTVWGGIVPYDSVWRAGANEATTFEASSDVQVEGKTLPAGKYSLFAIPGQNEWTFIFNKKANQWGAYTYNAELDQLRVKATPRKSASFAERLSYAVTPAGLVFRWENLEVPLTIK